MLHILKNVCCQLLHKKTWAKSSDPAGIAETKPYNCGLSHMCKMVFGMPVAMPKPHFAY